jgi:Ca-activated chloride channel family protein
MRLKSLLLSVVFAFSLPAPIYTQISKSNDEDIVRVNTHLIDVPLMVMDKAGRPLLNLTRNNFVIYEEGKKQEITDFSTASAPFEVALLLDTSGSTRSDLELIQRAAETFISSLRPGDRVSIIAYRAARSGDKERAISEVLSGLTEDREKLNTALAAVETSHGTPYYDSLKQVADKVFTNQPEERFRGRRALVALTDGVDSNSDAEYETAKLQFEKAGIISYFIQVDTEDYFENNVLGDCHSSLWFSRAQIRRYYDKYYPQKNFEKIYDFCQLGQFERLDISSKLYKIADAEMSEMARSSGGKVFPVADLRAAKDAFTKVAQEIGTKYSLGYYSDNEAHDGTFRKIRVELKGAPAGATVRAREGYTAPRN